MKNYERVRNLREDSDFTQKQTAEKLFLHLTQYRRYECGESEIPLNIAINIAKLYGVSLDYLAGLSDVRKVMNKSSLSDTEIELIEKFRKLSRTAQGRLLERADVLLNELN